MGIGRTRLFFGRFLIPLYLHGSKLEHLELDLSGVNSWDPPEPIGPSVFASVARGCPKLKYLHLEGTVVSEDDILSFVAHCSGLQHVCARLQEGGSALRLATALRRHCASLESVELRRGWELSEGCFTGLGRLCKLVLHQSADDDDLQHILPCLPRLEHLELPRSYNVTTLQGVSLFLTHLVMPDCDLTDAAMQSVIHNCPLLQRLSVGGRHITTLLCSRLVQLKMIGTELLTDAAMSSVLRGCPALEQLNVSHSLSLTKLEADCPRLTRLVAQYCERLTTFGGTLERLEHADLKDCLQLEAVSAVCKALQTLELNGCPRLAILPVRRERLEHTQPTWSSAPRRPGVYTQRLSVRPPSRDNPFAHGHSAYCTSR